jgi:hypothetical protein
MYDGTMSLVMSAKNGFTLSSLRQAKPNKHRASMVESQCFKFTKSFQIRQMNRLLKEEEPGKAKA